MISDYENKKMQKMRSDDRILILEPIEGSNVRDVTGKVDPRLFKGGNRLHATKDSRYPMWRLRYEMGVVPEPFKQTFTSFQGAYQHAEQYFKKRGLKITKVVDWEDETPNS